MKTNKRFARGRFLPAALLISAVLSVAFFAGCNKTSEEKTSLVVYSPHPVDFITEVVRNFGCDIGIQVEASQKGSC
jgi:hypothetical protein